MLRRASLSCSIRAFKFFQSYNAPTGHITPDILYRRAVRDAYTVAQAWRVITTGRGAYTVTVRVIPIAQRLAYAAVMACLPAQGIARACSVRHLLIESITYQYVPGGCMALKAKSRVHRETLAADALRMCGPAARAHTHEIRAARAGPHQIKTAKTKGKESRLFARCPSPVFVCFRVARPPGHEGHGPTHQNASARLMPMFCSSEFRQKWPGAPFRNGQTAW